MAERQKHLQKREGEKRAGTSFLKPSPGSRRAASRESPAADILHLQRTLGNREVRRLIKSGTLQAKLNRVSRLTINQPNDKYEQEADRVADKVMRMPDPRGPAVQRESTCPDCQEKEESVQAKPLADQITPLVQRQAEPEEEEEVQTKLQRQEGEEEEEPLQAKGVSSKSPAVTPSVESKVQSLKGGGQPLPESTRSFFESRFGSDFSGVRVHNDSQAAETAESVNAKAFTTGKDVVFGAGQYSPGTSPGKQLLAHELTHVVQQSKKNCTSNQVQRKDRKWPFNGYVINNSNVDVTVWSDAKGDFTIAANSTSDRFGEDVDHIKDNAGQWYKIGANTVTVDPNGNITGYSCKVSSKGANC
ncbi:MAG: DUF4157 domain-containing protein [bacterium]|nr:DUF4157 domain-containing protein [bacterium]